MSEEEILQEIKDFLKKERQLNKKFYEYALGLEPDKFFKNQDIRVSLNSHKEIILQEETGLELGGMNFKSFSLVYPSLNALNIENGKISLLGYEIDGINQKGIDFGLMIFIQGKGITSNIRDQLKHFYFISDGIEGFSIRSIPQRFWCRIKKDILEKNFSFEFLGKAIMYLYKLKFGSLIEAMEIIFVNYYINVIEKLISITSKLREMEQLRWKKKVSEWKKRIDCDYEWDCQICPYVETCEDLRKVLDSRYNLED